MLLGILVKLMIFRLSQPKKFYIVIVVKVPKYIVVAKLFILCIKTGMFI